MRIRATVAAVSGALALSAFAVPAAQADDSASWADAAKLHQAAHTASGKTALSSRADAEGEPYALNATFSNFKIAKAVKVGTTNKVSTTVTYTLTHGADVDIKAADFDTGPYLYKGAYDAPDNMLFGDLPAKCTATTATTATCTGKIDVYPANDELLNSDAGTWKGAALAIAYNGQDPAGEDFDITKVGYADQGSLGSTLIQRYSKLTVNASPEPVKKGKTITVTGKLSRANWEDNKYHGYTNQPVKLQFRKKGSNTYTTVKTIKSNSTGNLKTTVTASTDGYFRYSFAGTSTTPAVKAAGDFVDVQ
ncbi:hypothetical protein [Streptomyces dysideae]|uniref:Lipoprotein n=1 Tax=Streptomyces dysideae TaxID=909626 RepID=A0A117S1B0_9ACTN|nr:hypothetical protein [Streptomyces dysideae]KUO20359.1 hypothetical protein AQJ91_14540 [Streptomyces dysideae]